jgi:hypothetical protein
MYVYKNLMWQVLYKFFFYLLDLDMATVRRPLQPVESVSRCCCQYQVGLARRRSSQMMRVTSERCVKMRDQGAGVIYCSSAHFSLHHWSTTKYWPLHPHFHQSSLLQTVVFMCMSSQSQAIYAYVYLITKHMEYVCGPIMHIYRSHLITIL